MSHPPNRSTSSQASKQSPRPFDTVKADVDAVRRQKGHSHELKCFEVHRLAAEIIVTSLRERGRFYNDGKIAYFLLDAENILMTIQQDNQDLELALSRYGVAPSEPLFRYLLDALRLEALQHGTRTEVQPFVHYDRKTFTLYLFDLGQHVYRITADCVERVNNGTDGVLFVRNPAWKPFTVGTPKPDCSLLEETIFAPTPFRDSHLPLEDQKLLFRLWFYTLFFPELFPTRPILSNRW